MKKFLYNDPDICGKEYKRRQKKIFDFLKSCRYIKYLNGELPRVFEIENVTSCPDGYIYISPKNSRSLFTFTLRLFAFECNKVYLRIYELEDVENETFFF
jgi:hypothetical protein